MIIIADVLPKLKWYLFISMICLMINISACTVAYMQSGQVLNDYALFEEDEIDIYNVEESTNISTGNFALAVSTSFIPFVDIINLAFLGLDFVTSLIVGIIIIVFGAIKTLLLLWIALGHVPFINI